MDLLHGTVKLLKLFKVKRFTYIVWDPIWRLYKWLKW